MNEKNYYTIVYLTGIHNFIYKMIKNGGNGK